MILYSWLNVINFELRLSFICKFCCDCVLSRNVFQGESAEARMYLPETNTSRHIVIALSENMKIMGRDGTVIEPTAATTSGGQTEKKWRKICLKRYFQRDQLTSYISCFLFASYDNANPITVCIYIYMVS